MICEENDKLLYSFFKQDRNDGISTLKVDKYEHGELMIPQNIQLLIDEYITDRYDDGVDSVYELLYRLKENIETRPTCKRCHSRVVFANKHYHKFCSTSCASSYNADTVREKKKQWLCELKKDPVRWAKYIDDKQKAGKKTASLVKTDATYKEAYKKRATLLNHKVWGGYDDNDRKRRCEAMSAGWKKKFSSMTKDEYADYKSRCSQRAMNEWNNKTKEEKEKFAHQQRKVWNEKTDQQRQDWWAAVVAAKTANGTPTFPSRESKQETDMYNMIHETYPDAIRWYRDKRYGFYECDIYVPSKDAFIECQFFKTHGRHAFDPNNENDVQFVETLKHDKFCHYDYKTFSARDPHKRRLAAENNLNFFELWDSKDADKTAVMTWLSQLKTIEKQSKNL